MSERKALIREGDWLAALDLDDDAPECPSYSSLFAPSARWLAPSAEDKARVREALAAQEREALREDALWDAKRLDAVQRDVPPVLDCTGDPERSWLDRAGAALCLALPLAAVAAFLACLAR